MTRFELNLWAVKNELKALGVGLKYLTYIALFFYLLTHGAGPFMLFLGLLWLIAQMK